MSNKSARKVKLPPPTPRTMEKLQEENGRLTAKAGMLQYQILVYEQELKRTNKELFDLNHEAAARQELDKPVVPVVEASAQEVANG